MIVTSEGLMTEEHAKAGEIGGRVAEMDHRCKTAPTRFEVEDQFKTACHDRVIRSSMVRSREEQPASIGSEIGSEDSIVEREQRRPY